MRYFRMYVFINVIMTGVMRPSETPQQEVLHDTSTPPVDEEPPQKESESTLPAGDEDIQSTNAVQQTQEPAQNISEVSSAVIPETTPSADNAIITPKEQVQSPQTEESIIQEPTLEEAEQLIEQPTQQTLMENDISIPKQPAFPSDIIPAEPMSHAVMQEPTIHEPASRGIDTVNLEQPQGNWLFKRYWWERAEELYKKIRTNVEKINDIRVKFFTQRTELDKKILDPFYADIGLTQSELQTSMQSLMTQLEQERKKNDTLSEEEREIISTVQKDRERLDQLQRDVTAIGGLRDLADRVIDRIVDQKKRASDYESEAWEYMREIGRIVSDIQASELYYRMDAGWRTVKDIYKYVDQDLNKFFDTLLINAKEQTERIKIALQGLKEQGIDLKLRMQEAQEHATIKQEQAIEEDKEKKPAVAQKTGWFASTSRVFQAVIDVAIWQFLQSIWDIIMWLPRRIYSTITSLFR